MASVLGFAYSSSTSDATSHYSSAVSLNGTPQSPRSNYSAASSSGSLAGGSQDADDDENATITFNRLSVSDSATGSGQGSSQDSEDIRLLAISTHITELSYAISDIQTRIFEIQELRHKSQSQSNSSEHGSPSSKDSNVTAIIDQSLMTLDEKLESVEKGIKAVTENVESLCPPPAPTPTTANTITAATTPKVNNSFSNSSEVASVVRKHKTLLADWEAVQEESDVLREELKEDKWLTVFRTVTDQADGMMSSLEKAVNRCQDFIYQVHHGPAGITQEDFFSSSPASSRDRQQPVNLDTFTSLLESYEAKKKHYMPATSKVLAIIDRGVRDRVTKNGETLRRHSESAQRWKTLRDRIARTDSEMEHVHKLLLGQDPALSDAGSSTSGTSRNGYLATPSNGKGNALSRSISPFRKFARKITGSSRPSDVASSPPQPVQISPLQVSKKSRPLPGLPTAASPPDASRTLRRQRTSLLPSARNYEQATPERPGHKLSQSLTPDSSPRIGRQEESIASHLARSTYSSSSKGRPSVSQANGTPGGTVKPTWNGSTKVEDSNGTVRGAPGRHSRPPSASGMYKTFSSMGGHEDVPPVPSLNQSGTPYKRSLSRTSMVSSRPWSPIGSSQSTSQSSSIPPMPISNHSSMSNHSRLPSRPPSRAQTPSRSASRAASYGAAFTPRTRPKTPSHIPTPSLTIRSASSTAALAGAQWSPESETRPFSPAFSTSGVSTATPGGTLHPPRPPSRSMIPIPKVHLSASSPGRSTSSMSHIPGGYNRAGSESPTFLMSHFKSVSRRAQTPDMFTMGRSVSATTPGRPSVTRLPPSSYRDSGSTYSPSRPGSRTGTHDNSSKLSLSNSNDFFEYVVGNPNDPLDVEVGNVVNSVPHGLVVERVDPHLKKAPKEGEEVKAQYAFSNAFGKKVVSLRLTTLTRATRSASEGGAGEKPRVTMVTTKKVMCRVGGGWQDLGIYLMNRSQGL